MRTVPHIKPIDEITYWKRKSDKLTKAFKLVNDERVKALTHTIDMAIGQLRLDQNKVEE